MQVREISGYDGRVNELWHNCCLLKFNVVFVVTLDNVAVV